MARRATDLKPSANLSIRLMGEEATRYNELLTKAGQQPFAKKADLIRELLGLRPLRLVTKRELEHFRAAGKEEDEASSKKTERGSRKGRPKEIKSPPNGEDLFTVTDPPTGKKEDRDNGEDGKDSKVVKRR